MAGLIFMSGCATGSWEQMQADGSYKITARRPTIFQSNEKDEAYSKAKLLCPKGFDTDSEFPSASKEYTLIVHCQNSSRLPAGK